MHDGVDDTGTFKGQRFAVDTCLRRFRQFVQQVRKANHQPLIQPGQFRLWAGAG